MAGATDDAKDYVESIMSTQPVPVNIYTCTPDNHRKRHLSDPSCGHCSTVKKARNTGNSIPTTDTNPSNLTNNHLSSIDLCSEPPESHESPTGTLSKENQYIEQLILKLSADVLAMQKAVSDRIDKLESGLEQKIINKVSQILDKRVNTEMSRVKKDVETKLVELKSDIQAEVTAEFDVINEKLSSFDKAINSETTDLRCNIVIRNLPESNNENTLQKVNALIREGLKLRSVSVLSADRKVSNNVNNPGVIVASCRNENDKSQIMTYKRSLKSSRQYSNVYIEHDQPKSERLIASNFRAILTAIRRRDTTVRMHGAKIVVQNSVENTRTTGTTGDGENRKSGNNQNGQFRNQSNDGRYKNNRNDNSQRNGNRGRGRGRGRGHYRN